MEPMPGPPRVSAAILSREGMGSLSAIIQLFHRVGKELLIEGLKDAVRKLLLSSYLFEGNYDVTAYLFRYQLVLRTLNDAKTSFAAVELHRGVFFQEYMCDTSPRRPADPSVSPDTEEEPFLGKVSLKVSKIISLYKDRVR